MYRSRAIGPGTVSLRTAGGAGRPTAPRATTDGPTHRSPRSLGPRRGQETRAERRSGAVNTAKRTHLPDGGRARGRSGFEIEPNSAGPGPETRQTNPARVAGASRCVKRSHNYRDFRDVASVAGLAARAGSRSGRDGVTGARVAARAEDRHGRAGRAGAGPAARAGFGRSCPSCPGAGSRRL